DSRPWDQNSLPPIDKPTEFPAHQRSNHPLAIVVSRREFFAYLLPAWARVAYLPHRRKSQWQLCRQALAYSVASPWIAALTAVYRDYSWSLKHPTRKPDCCAECRWPQFDSL